MGGDARYELIEGVLKEVLLSSLKPGVIGMRIGSAIFVHVEEHDLGYVSNADGGDVLERDPSTVVAPDVGFIRKDRFPDGLPERGFARVPPDLAVEVISPTDTQAAIAQKQELYARAGVPLVWWSDPEARTVTVHRSGQRPEIKQQSATLDGGDVLAGFLMPIARIFCLERNTR